MNIVCWAIIFKHGINISDIHGLKYFYISHLMFNIAHNTLWALTFYSLFFPQYWIPYTE